MKLGLVNRKGRSVLGNYLVLLVLAILVFGGPVQAQKAASPEELFARGVESLRQGRFEEAEEALLEALQEGVDTVILHHNLGIVYQRKQQHEKAIAQFKEALSLDPNLPATRALMGASLIALNQTDEGIGELELAVQGLPEDLIIRIQLANAYEAAGRVLEAVGQYREIAKQHPDDPESAYRLGKAYAAAADWSYGKMVKVDSNSARVHQALGQNLLSLGDFEAAARAFRRAIKSDPELPDIHLALAHALLRQGNLVEALEAVEGELGIVPWNVGAQRLKAQISARLESSPGG